MLLIVSNELGKVCLRATMSWGEMVGWARLGLWGLRADLSQVVEDALSAWDIWVLRTDLGQMLELGNGK